jgi:hypothetical protein
LLCIDLLDEGNDEWVPHGIVYRFGFEGLHLGGAVGVKAKFWAPKSKGEHPNK